MQCRLSCPHKPMGNLPTIFKGFPLVFLTKLSFALHGSVVFYHYKPLSFVPGHLFTLNTALLLWFTFESSFLGLPNVFCMSNDVNEIRICSWLIAVQLRGQFPFCQWSKVMQVCVRHLAKMGAMSILHPFLHLLAVVQLSLMSHQKVNPPPTLPSNPLAFTAPTKQTS